MLRLGELWDLERHAPAPSRKQLDKCALGTFQYNSRAPGTKGEGLTPAQERR